MSTETYNSHLFIGPVRGCDCMHCQVYRAGSEAMARALDRINTKEAGK